LRCAAGTGHEGAAECSHGWIGGAAEPAGVEPVVVWVQLSSFRPGGAAESSPFRERTEMPGTHSQILLHIVFSTKRREPWISAEVAERLYPYIGGIVRAERGVLYDIGGIEDHVHLYLRWRPDESVSNLMRTVKARSSLWVHQTLPKLAAFAWQEGYAAFSVSKSQEEAVKKYIAGQAEHHTKEDFKAELLRFLRAHEIEFDERYVFD
jgi:REP element-mobilizing transposase RayT